MQQAFAIENLCQKVVCHGNICLAAFCVVNSGAGYFVIAYSTPPSVIY